MLKYYDTYDSFHIVIDAPIVTDDMELLESLFLRQYISYHIEFGRIYSICIDLILILYREIFINKQNILITTHKNKLNRYLHRLGFKASFVSLIKEDVIKIIDIDIILIGGSANSSKKIIDIVKNITLDNITLILVQHIDPHQVGFFDEILQNNTRYKVSYVKNEQKIKKSQIYIAPANKHLEVMNGYFYLSDTQMYNFSKPSISISYESFSNFYKERLLVIQECGYADDGVDKIQLLKDNGSKLIIQDIEECKAKPMVRNALNLNLHDYYLNKLSIIYYINLVDKQNLMDRWIDYLLEMIYLQYEYDFRLYHRDMLNHRLSVFMIKHKIKDIKDAIGVILFNKSAFKAFFLEISINVTELFRNPKSFINISLFFNKFYKHSHNIKIWSAGCSSGEEVYSTAIILDNLKLLDKSIIYSTDFNSVVLEEAKNGIYAKESYIKAKNNYKQMEFKNNLDEYFKINDNFVIVNDKIKKKTLFFQHNLIKDSSFNEFDIIICKNVIIYFTIDLQEKVFKLFYDSLKFGGHLVLGESETMIEKFKDKFEQPYNNCNIFKKVA